MPRCNEQDVGRLKCSRGIRTIGTATTADEAKLLQDAGLDLVVASSFEAGGHKGSFLRPPEVSLTGMISLVPQVVDSVTIPVIAAGGIAGSRGVAAAFMLGAEAVQIGTAFLVCKGSGVNPIHREALLSAAAKVTGLTKGFSGRLARGIRNRIFEELESSQETPLPYPIQRSLLGLYAQAAIEQERADLLPMWAGQSAPLIEHLEVEPLMRSLIEEVAQLLQQFASDFKGVGFYVANALERDHAHLRRVGRRYVSVSRTWSSSGIDLRCGCGRDGLRFHRWCSAGPMDRLEGSVCIGQHHDGVGSGFRSIFSRCCY